MPLLKGEVTSTKDCYELCASFPWSTVLKPASTLAVDFMGVSDFIRNSVFGAQLVKDAVVDNLRKARNERPNVDLEKPDCLIHARLHHGELTVFYDLSGHSLHQRGYRKDAGAAPLKENLAAALLIRAGWPKMMKTALIDPFCGSGTLLIEAAMMASDKAPGLDRLDYGFLAWQSHDAKMWDEIQAEALERHETAMDAQLAPIFGFDADEKVLTVAKRNIRAAGFEEMIRIEKRAISKFALPTSCADKKGLIVCNPPYGERLGESDELLPVYAELGVALKQTGWPAAVFTSDPELARATRLRSHKQYAFLNGRIPCKLYLFEFAESNYSS
jgi:23S rRNA (guanine2445-N2)-methyltransferase / 23S rRNA (guanine2069-N7)-methyltransferase